MIKKSTYEELEQRVKDLEEKLAKQDIAEELLLRSTKKADFSSKAKIEVSGITIEWDIENGVCTFETLPVAIMWVDTTLAGLMSGVQSMVGKERFALSLQAEGRESVEADWQVISQFSEFQEGFEAIANVAAVAGWGEWRLISLHKKRKECHFRIKGNWEGKYQKALGVCWGSGFLAGKLAGYASKLFSTNCWAKQTAFTAKGDQFDEFVVKPSDRTIEKEIENLLLADEATKADMAVALQKLQKEIAERKQVEDKLIASEMFLNAIVENIPDMIFVKDAEELRFVRLNKAGEDLLGYSREELIGKTDYDFFTKEEADFFTGKDRTVLDKGILFDIPEEPIQTKYKGERILHTKKIPVLDVKGQPKYLLGISEDITESKRLENQLQQAQKMESIGTLAGGIAHDFNNVLYSIIGYTELTMDDMPKGSLANENLKEVLKGAMRAKDMVQQILAFSRKADTQKKPIKVQSVVKEALKLLRTSIPSTIEIRQNIDADCSPVLADSTQIHQVVMNLGTNAYHAMREKGGILEISLRQEEIGPDDSKYDLNLHPGSYLKLIVEDTGHGIDSNIMEKIFDPYFTTKGIGEGTGMGLPVVYGVVKDHGGDISVYSEPGKGTAFHVYLPLIENGTVEREIISAEPAPTGTEHILFVDDEETIVYMTQQILESLGYHVTSRTSSVEALEAFRARPDEFDLVITDMTMPNMTGAELAPRLLEIRSDIPIILCTGFSELMDENKAKAMGIREYVMKPIVRDKIAGTIRKVLDIESEK